MSGPLLELDAVSRLFGSFTAVDGARIAIRPGAIHAIIGENGAGKSTLLKIAAGVIVPLWAPCASTAAPSLRPPAEAIRRSVRMVHQQPLELLGAPSTSTAHRRALTPRS